MQNDVIRTLSKRRSHRAYKAEQLTSQQLEILMTAAISSPSANNHQPWHFSAVQDQALLNLINQEAHKTALTLPEASRSPRFANQDFHVFYHAPTVIFISSNEKKELDCGIAVISIALAAESIGLGSVILGLPGLAFQGSAKPELERALQFPKGYSFSIAIAVGYPDDEKEPPVRDQRKVSIVR
jgi:nitroreductase